MSFLARPARVALSVPFYRLIPDKRRYGAWLRRELQAAGCVYVKLGQWVSSRDDIFHPDLAGELSGLRADNPPEDPAAAAAAVATLPPDARRHLADFDPAAPVSCGSVAQVHVASWKGRPAAVKVLRPGVARAIRRDVALARLLVGPLRSANPRAHADLTSSLAGLETSLDAETNFRQEARNMRIFRDFYSGGGGGGGGGDVVVPRVHAVSPACLVMSHEPSRPLAPGEDAARTPELLDLFVGQLFDLGIVHADMHAGNLGVHPASDKLVLYDFGAVTRVSPRTASGFKQIAITSMGGRDASLILDYMFDYGLLVSSSGATPTAAQRATLESFVSSLAEYAEDADVRGLMRGLTGRGGPGGPAAGPAAAGPDGAGDVAFSPECLALGRTFTLLEGTCKALDPAFSIARAVGRSDAVVRLAQDPEVFRFKARDDLVRVARLFGL